MYHPIAIIQLNLIPTLAHSKFPKPSTTQIKYLNHGSVNHNIPFPKAGITTPTTDPIAPTTVNISVKNNTITLLTGDIKLILPNTNPNIGVIHTPTQIVVPKSFFRLIIPK
ncbi:hypothetical protein A3K55_00380 [Candidatus Shapirobacteria bacterium RBG_13_44_7]|uniref:Uncharacterized protein n=1 Tax=Candidatus Shapirobacteria bacterium RBG_13_44_7 TaxID=1802149 RepID=A0A1F7SGM9_9BACT|nr:MAG: hypothetical protein A3K55_00380 [Candidatus Shapirobacteria bacterium RBG_13_44_7]